MRVLAIIAIFCLAVSALGFNVAAYHSGFADQLRLTTQQTRDAARCQNSINKTVTSFLSLLNNNNATAEFLVYTGLDVYNGIKKQIVEDCQSYLMSLAFIVLNQTSFQDPTIVAQKNYQTYSPYIVQQLAIWSDAFISGNDYKAGQTFAYIIQILFGIQKPQVLPQMLGMTRYTEFNATRFINEFTESYFKNIGLKDNTTLNATVKCVNQLISKTPSLIASYEALSGLKTFEQQLIGSTKVYDQLIDLITPCAGAAKGQVAFTTPYVRAFAASPVLFTAKFIHNLAYNAPQIEQLQQQQARATTIGSYTYAGQVSAQLFNLVFNGLV